MQTIFYNNFYLNNVYGLSSLTTDEQHHNALALGQLLFNKRCTENFIGGLLGNIYYESGINPGALEAPGPTNWPNTLPTNAEALSAYDDPDDPFYRYVGGMGLTQWTPGADKIVRFAEANNLIWYDGRAQASKLVTEFPDGILHSHGDPADIAEWILQYYERPATWEEQIPMRRRAGTYWYNEIEGKLISPIKRFMISQNNRKRKELKRRCLRI